MIQCTFKFSNTSINFQERVRLITFLQFLTYEFQKCVVNATKSNMYSGILNCPGPSLEDENSNF